MHHKEVLVPVDFEKTDRSLDALQFVGGLAGEMAVNVTLLYVITDGVVWADHRARKRLLEGYQGTFAEISRRFLSDCRSNRFRVRAGKAHEQIIREAQEESPELIVLSRPGRSRWNWLRSRTAELVVREAPCLTLILPHAWKISSEQYRQAMTRSKTFRDGHEAAWVP